MASISSVHFTIWSILLRAHDSLITSVSRQFSRRVVDLKHHPEIIHNIGHDYSGLEFELILFKRSVVYVMLRPSPLMTHLRHVRVLVYERLSHQQPSVCLIRVEQIK